MKLLKLALIGNTGFSLLSGLVLSVVPKYMANLFETPNFIPFFVTGLALIFFSYTILIEIKPQRRGKVLWIIVQDLLWVLGSIYLLVTRPLTISGLGYTLIAWVAVVVLVLALLQAIGWWRKERMMRAL